MMDRMFSTMLPSGVNHLDSLSKMNNAGLGVKLMRKVMRDKGVATPAAASASAAL